MILSGRDQKKTLCLIPSFNNEDTIEKVVICCKNYVNDILVINDGSKDNTASILQRNNITAITNQRNLGKGASLAIGFRYALKNNYDLVVMLDADGEHDPCDIPKLIQPLIHANFQVAYGAREKTHSSLIFGNQTTRYIFQSSTGVDVFDPMCGFKAMKIEVVEAILPHIKSKSFDIDLEICLLVLLYKFNSINVAISNQELKDQFGIKLSHVESFILNISRYPFLTKSSLALFIYSKRQQIYNRDTISFILKNDLNKFVFNEKSGIYLRD